MNKGWNNLSIDSLIEADWNYKKDDNQLLDKLVENIKLHGQVETIIVRELKNNKFEVVNGNHRLKAFKVAGITEIHCFNLGKVSDNYAKRVAIETNETRFASDPSLLGKLLEEITSEINLDELVKTLPMSQDDVEGLIKLNEYDFTEFDQTAEAKEPAEKAKETKITLVVKTDEYDRVRADIDILLKSKNYQFRYL